MNRQPLNRIQLFDSLKRFAPQMQSFKAHGNATLKAHEVELMGEIYNDVRALAPGQMGISLNKSCPGCIRDAFHVFCSVFDRLAKDPHVNPQAVAPENEDLRNEQLHLSPESEQALFGYLRIGDGVTPQEYLIRLKAFIAKQDPAINISDLTEKRDALQDQVNTLPNPLELVNEITIYNDAYDLGLTEEQIEGMTFEELTAIMAGRDLDAALSQPDPAKDLPEHLQKDAQLNGIPLNTASSQTPAQKLAAARAKKAKQ